MKKYLLILLMTNAITAYSAPILLTDNNGQVTGVSNIEATSGSFFGTFDVKFLDGTCIELFDGCTSIADSLAINAGLLTNANEIILETLGLVSDTPDAIFGCESSTQCLITGVNNINLAGPNGGSISGNTLSIGAGPGNDNILSESFAALRTTDFSFDPTRVFSVFTVSTPNVVTPVPFSGSFALVILGLLGFVARRTVNFVNS